MSDDVRNCPECGTELTAWARHCKCGWGRAKKPQAVIDPLRHQCAWEADGKRCRYPGTVGRSVNGSGPWFCRWHDDCADPVHGARLVEESQSYTPEDTKREMDEAVTASLIRFGLQAKPGESARDHAERMRALVLEKLRAGVTKPLPYDPRKLYGDVESTSAEE